MWALKFPHRMWRGKIYAIPLQRSTLKIHMLAESIREIAYAQAGRSRHTEDELLDELFERSGLLPEDVDRFLFRLALDQWAGDGRAMLAYNGGIDIQPAGGRGGKVADGIEIVVRGPALSPMTKDIVIAQFVPGADPEMHMPRCGYTEPKSATGRSV